MRDNSSAVRKAENKNRDVVRMIRQETVSNSAAFASCRTLGRSRGVARCALPINGCALPGGYVLCTRFACERKSIDASVNPSGLDVSWRQMNAKRSATARGDTDSPPACRRCRKCAERGVLCRPVTVPQQKPPPVHLCAERQGHALYGAVQQVRRQGEAASRSVTLSDSTCSRAGRAGGTAWLCLRARGTRCGRGLPS